MLNPMKLLPYTFNLHDENIDAEAEAEAEADDETVSILTVVIYQN